MKNSRIYDRIGLDFSAIRDNLEIDSEFTLEEIAEAEAKFSAHYDRLDHTHLPFIAIDPPGATDLDQAFYIERTNQGFQVLYAIADVAEFVEPGSAIDAASKRRGVTQYSPDMRAGLYPPTISEDRGSLLAGTTKPCALWTIELTEDGLPSQWRLQRSTIQVAEAITYQEAQQRLDQGTDPQLALLAAVGKARILQESQRDAVSINLPSQEVHTTGQQYRLELNFPLQVEKYNAQLSLLTGIVAGKTLSELGAGILRTLPRTDPEVEEELRQVAEALNLHWPEDSSYATFVRSIFPSTTAEFAFLNQATRAFRGASYVSLAHTNLSGEDLEHSAIASVYAHVTAPLRRLVDRFNNEILIAHFSNKTAPNWAADVSELPGIMNRSNQLASALDRAMIDYIECVVLKDQVGQTFKARVINKKHIKDKAVSVIQIDSSAVIYELQDWDLKHGQEILLRLNSVDVGARQLTFSLVAENQ